MQRVLIRSICLLLSVFLSAFPAASEEYFLVRVDDERKSDETEVQLLERLGFIYMRSVDSGRREVHLVSAPYELSKSFIRELKRSERRLRHIELVEDLYLTDMVENEACVSAFKGALDYAEAIASQGSKKENFHGAKVLRGYAKQRLVDILDFDSVHRHYGTGDAVIAVIDTGVDPFHPGLVGSLAQATISFSTSLATRRSGESSIPSYPNSSGSPDQEASINPRWLSSANLPSRFWTNPRLPS